MQPYVLETSMVLPNDVGSVFAFFEDAANLQALTPPWLHFEIKTPRPIRMKRGALIEYRIRLHGIPMRWRTLISRYEPPADLFASACFVDEQLKGPYLLWRHTHTFEPVIQPHPVTGGAICIGTRCGDRVEYIPFGGRLVEPWFVRPKLDRIFAYRQERLRSLLAPTISGKG